MIDETPIEKFEMWARVDLFGHTVRAGKLSVTNTGVEVLYRLDIPNDAGAFKTEFYGKGAVYSILPVSEEAARLISQKLGASAPIAQWDLPEQWREAMRVAQAKALPEHSLSSAMEHAAEYPETGDDASDSEEDEDDDEPHF